MSDRSGESERPNREAPGSAGQSAPRAAEDDFTLPRTRRLITQRDFRGVYGRGRRAHGREIVVVANRRDPEAGGDHRLGVAVSKENGRAVRRNKIKRLLREAFRLERPTLPGSYDIILIPRPREGRVALLALRGELRSLLSDIHSGRGKSRGTPRKRPHKGAKRKTGKTPKGGGRGAGAEQRTGEQDQGPPRDGNPH